MSPQVKGILSKRVIGIASSNLKPSAVHPVHSSRTKTVARLAVSILLWLVMAVASNNDLRDLVYGYWDVLTYRGFVDDYRRDANEWRCVPGSSIAIVKDMIASAVAKLGYRAGQFVGPPPKSCAGTGIADDVLGSDKELFTHLAVRRKNVDVSRGIVGPTFWCVSA